MPWNSTSLQGKHIRTSCLDTDHRQFLITTKDKFWDKLILIHKCNIQNSIINKIGLCEKLKGYFRPRKSINWCQKAVTLNHNPIHNHPKPAREANTYFWFGYKPKTIYKHTQGNVSSSINADPTNSNKQVKNQQF